MTTGVDSDITLFLGGIEYSGFGYAYLGIRFAIAFIIVTVEVIFDFIATIVGIFVALLQACVALWLPVCLLIFVALLVTHIYWADTVWVINHILMPLLNILFNDVIRFVWNDLFLPLFNILTYLWDSLVQLVGFFIYFALDLVMTIATLIVQVLGEIDLPAIFQDLMNIITPIVNLVIEVFKVLIHVEVAIIQLLIPIIIAILKIVLAYIKIVFKVWAFLFVTLFRVLMPILNLVVWVVHVCQSFFAASGSSASLARALLSVDPYYYASATSRQPDPTVNAQWAANDLKGLPPRLDVNPLENADPGEMMLVELYASATQYYRLDQYNSMFSTLDQIHNGIRQQDLIHSKVGALPDYTTHLYTAESLYEHEKGVPLEEMEYEKEEAEAQRDEEEGLTIGNEEGEMFAEPPRLANPGGRLRSLLSQETLDNLDRKRQEFLDSLKQEPGVKIEDEPESDAEEEVEEEEESLWESIQAIRNGEWKPYAVPKSKSKAKSKRSEATLVSDPYSALPPSEHWRVDFTHNMTSEQVFPALGGEKLKRPQLHLLTRKNQKPHEIHERRKRAAAYAHALQGAYYRVYSKYVTTGAINRVVHSTFKRLTGHDNVNTWMRSLSERYASPAHFLYENIPSTHDKGFLALLWKADPDYETRPPFHLWFERQFENNTASREFWDAHAEYELLREQHIQAGIESSDGSMLIEAHMQQLAKQKRKLLANFFSGLVAKLSILYEDDCYTTPRRNPLCIPQIPQNWTMGYINFSAVIFTSNLNNNTECQPVWDSTACIFCWDGVVVNGFQEVRFSLYFLDLLDIIFIVGLFTPQPTVLLGYIAKIFPPFQIINDILLIYPPGHFPDGQAWVCWIENWYYGYWWFMIGLIVYFIAYPIWEWFWRSYMTTMMILVSPARMRAQAYRQGSQQYTEKLLGRINRFYQMRKDRLERNNWRNYAPIRGELNGATGEAEPDHDALLAMTGIELELHEQRQTVAEKLDKLRELIGADAVPGVDNVAVQRRANRVWQFVTSALQLPFNATPAFTRHMRHYQDNVRHVVPPPLADHYAETHSPLAAKPPSSPNRGQ